MNLNDLAKKVTLLEGKKKSLSIAQVKEVISILSKLMYQDFDVITAMYKLSKKKSK